MKIDSVSPSSVFPPSLHLLRMTSSKCKPKHRLPSDFQPTYLDVLCGRGKIARVHAGTKCFRQCIQDNLPRYLKANSKEEKSFVVASIVNFLRCQAVSIGGAGFLRYDKQYQCWIEIGDCHAREKVGHALRDIIKRKSRLNSADPKKFSYVATTAAAQVSPVPTITQPTVITAMPPTATHKDKNHDDDVTRKSLFRTQRNLFLSYIHADIGKWYEHESQTKHISEYYDRQNYGL